MKEFFIGQTQTLIVKRFVDFGAYLGFSEEEGEVLLPKKQIPDGTKEGNLLEVFIYRDSEDRLIATTNKPTVYVGEIGRVKVKTVTKIGAFLDWGLEKDLFLPYKEMEGEVAVGDEICVYVYLDKSRRISASMRLYDHLCPVTKGELVKDEEFTGYIYRVNKKIGAFTAVFAEGKYFFGLIPASQVFERYKIGQEVKGRVVRVRPDGKLDLSPRKKAYAQIENDAETILSVMHSYEDTLPFSESASPELIERELHMSKAAFKRALGHLYKEEKIEIAESEVRLLRNK